MINPRGLVGILLIIIILISGVASGVYLLLQRTNFLPKANFQDQKPAFLLQQYDPKFPYSTNNSSSVLVPPEGSFTIDVLITTGLQPISSFSTHIYFPKTLLKVNSLDATSFGAVPLNWIDQYFDNDRGQIVLTASAYSDGFKSAPDQKALLVRVNFQVQPNISGKIGKIEFSEEKTFMIRKVDGNSIQNIVKNPFEVRVSLESQ